MEVFMNRIYAIIPALLVSFSLSAMELSKTAKPFIPKQRISKIDEAEAQNKCKLHPIAYFKKLAYLEEEISLITKEAQTMHQAKSKIALLLSDVRSQTHYLNNRNTFKYE